MQSHSAAVCAILSMALAALVLPTSTAFAPHRPSFVRQHSRPVLYTATTSGDPTLGFPEDHPHPTESEPASGISSLEHCQTSPARPPKEPTTTPFTDTTAATATAAAAPSPFVQGDDLQRLRTEVWHLKHDLQAARARHDTARIDQLSNAILAAQQVDAEYLYGASKQRWHDALNAGRTAEAAWHRAAATRARNALPQFNLQGLWVGKYSPQATSDYELINVTYAGDVLIAYKVTGDENVPAGQVSFHVDLGESANWLDPIRLDPDAAQQWGSRFLPRFAGQGQVASKGFVRSQWLTGQLILVNSYFSFAWLPIGHSVFFGRPSPELTLKLLRESKKHDDVREHLERCMEETLLLEDDLQEDALFSSHHEADYYHQAGCFE